MKRIAWILIMTVFLAVNAIPSVSAQEEDVLLLRLQRDFGYGGGVDIQGSFSLKVMGPDDLVRVVYFIDGEVMGESTEASAFRFKFSTGDYPLGVHKFSATGYTADGSEYESNTITKNFVSPQKGTTSALKIVGVILVILLGVSGIAFLITWFAGGKRRGQDTLPLGAPRSYGMLGGTICPKCSRPFSRHIWGFNIVVGKYDRCPHCGKWSVTRQAAPAELQAAEEAELSMIESDQISIQGQPSEEERLRKDIDDSRFSDF